MIHSKEIMTKRFATVKQVPLLYPAFSEASMRWLIFNGENNNFAGCIKRVGRKILIDLDKFEEWIDSQK